MSSGRTQDRTHWLEPLLDSGQGLELTLEQTQGPKPEPGPVRAYRQTRQLPRAAGTVMAAKRTEILFYLLGIHLELLHSNQQVITPLVILNLN